MVSFYRSQLIANKEIDSQFNACKNIKSDLSIPLLVLNITSRFEVGEKQVYKRINLLVSSLDGDALINGDYVEFK